MKKQNPQLLKTHLIQQHRKLMDLGFGIDENGLFQWKPELLDYVLM
jgi:hypothetical protein